MNKITKDTIIKEMFLNFPEKSAELADILTEAGVLCVGCCASAWETLGEGLKSHGITKKDLENIIFKLNNAVAKGC